ncbi:hypothetical protein NitYY0826_P29 (plasmid) [Nitratiruptor sp. YY08-26]|nr:hypothetical protein NitYY0813_P29 [Nitratiruptor sp. YY08-13]BCD67124.1 hypothetical protein NitYY0826_P29 [Nitratiruptor sp. YY08-26]
MIVGALLELLEPPHSCPGKHTELLELLELTLLETELLDVLELTLLETELLELDTAVEDPPPPHPVKTTVAVNSEAAITLIILVFCIIHFLNSGI